MPARERWPDTFARVLLVEDDASVGEGLLELLELEGVEASLVRSAGEAIAHLETAKPDTIILDIALPDQPGTVVLEEARRRWPAIPVLISSGHASRADFDGTRGVAFLQKPFEFRTLCRAATELARGR